MDRNVLIFSMLVGALVATALPAQDSNKFRLNIGGTLTGTEEYSISKTSDGFRLAGKTQLQGSGQTIELVQEQTLTSARALRRYKVEAHIGGQTQSVEAWTQGEQIQLRASAGGTPREKSVTPSANTLVLDNLLFSHYQVLLDRVAGKVPGNESWLFIVGSRFAAVPGKLAAAGEEAGTLSGKSLRLRKYTVEVGSVLVEVWAEADSHRLMRVFIPMQKVEAVREGFALTPRPAEEAKRPAACVERDLKFPSGNLEMPGTLCVPVKRSGRVPVVVFVHGSGSHDRDETIGPNKPFRDLADGLAEAGIASLRYDKRTFAFPKSFDLKTAGLNEEAIDDAVAALKYVQSLPEVDPKQVFLLGHSLGATVAPFIAERSPALRGAILMAAAARPLDEMVLEQTRFQLLAAKQPEPEVARKLDDLKKQFARVRSGEAAEDEVVLMAPAHYWRDAIRHDVPAALRKLTVPVLVLQGERDVQVTKVDYDIIQQALAAKPAAQRESRLFPELNHLFMPAEASSTGAEYGRAGHVDGEVIRTISAWIKKQ